MKRPAASGHCKCEQDTDLVGPGGRACRREARNARGATKTLAEVTLAFWIMKICATTLGETAGDMFSQTLMLGYFLSTVALFASFVTTLIVQLRSLRYNPRYYWTVILTTSMAGATMSDFMNRDASAAYLAGDATSLGWGRKAWGWTTRPARRS